MIKAVLFDMDGVIVNSEEFWQVEETKWFTSLFEKWTVDDQKKITGLNLQDVYKLLTKEYGLDMKWEEFYQGYDSLAENIYRKKSSLITGFTDLINKLKMKNIKIGLVSAAPQSWIDMVIDNFHLDNVFSTTISGSSGNIPGKPNPDLFLRAAENLNVTPEECIGIEDSPNGCKAIKRAGMICVGLTSSFIKDDLPEVDHIIKDFTEFDREWLS